MKISQICIWKLVHDTCHSLKLRSWTDFSITKAITSTDLQQTLKLRVGRLANAEKMSNRLLTFRIFSFDLHQTTVCDSLALADMQIPSLNREKRKSMGSQRIIEGGGGITR